MSWDRPLTPPQPPLRWLVAMLPRLPFHPRAPSPLEVRSWLVREKRVWAVPGSPAEACCTLRELAPTAITAATTSTTRKRTRAFASGDRVRDHSVPAPVAEVNGRLVGRGRASRARQGSAGPGRRAC